MPLLPPRLPPEPLSPLLPCLFAFFFFSIFVHLRPLGLQRQSSELEQHDERCEDDVRKRKTQKLHLHGKGQWKDFGVHALLMRCSCASKLAVMFFFSSVCKSSVTDICLAVHTSISILFSIFLLSWLSVRNLYSAVTRHCLFNPQYTPTGKEELLCLFRRCDAMPFYLFEEKCDWNDLRRLICLFFNLFWSCIGSCTIFMFSGEMQTSVPLLQINESLFTKFPLISAFPCLLSCTQRASWYTADGWDTTAKDVDTVIARLMAPVI